MPKHHLVYETVMKLNITYHDPSSGSFVYHEICCVNFHLYGLDGLFVLYSALDYYGHDYDHSLFVLPGHRTPNCTFLAVQSNQ